MNRIALIGFLFFSLVVNPCWGQKAVTSVPLVRVGGYIFPPFVEENSQSDWVHQVLSQLQVMTKDYRFVFKKITAEGRYRELSSGAVDIIFFEDESWGWPASKVQYLKTKVVAEGGEAFVALHEPGRNQTYFENLSTKKIRGVSGYHYQIAEMKTDLQTLKKKNMTLGGSFDQNLKDLMDKKTDVSLFNTFWLRQLFSDQPALKDRLLVSEKWDQNYRLRAIVSFQSKISTLELEKLIDQIDFKKLGIKETPFSQ